MNNNICVLIWRKNKFKLFLEMRPGNNLRYIADVSFKGGLNMRSGLLASTAHHRALEQHLALERRIIMIQ